MSIFYSAAERGFFHPSIHDTMPGDAVEISDEEHAALLDGQAKGASIAPDKKGRPVLVTVSDSIEDVQAAQSAAIDDAADRAYHGIGARSPGRVVEYYRAKADALAFQAAGFKGAVPPSVDCVAKAHKLTPQAAAEQLIDEAAAWDKAVLAIRSARIGGLAKVAAATSVKAAIAAGEAAVEALQVIHLT